MSNYRFLSVVCFLFSVVSIKTTQACQVFNANGEDVTSQLVQGEEGVVTCQGSYACQNFTIAECATVNCIGLEACYFATMDHIAKELNCQENHSCHRVQVTFASPGTTSTGTQSITCQGEGACDVTQVTAPHAHLDCIGRKACRKINGNVRHAYCTGGDSRFVACTGHASLLVSECLLCGYLGCDKHMNMCRSKSEMEEVWKACLPDAAWGPSCSHENILALRRQVESQGQEVASFNWGGN